MTVLQVCTYGADYAENYIASLEALEIELQKRRIQTIYAFIDRASGKEWCHRIQSRTKVFPVRKQKFAFCRKHTDFFKRFTRKTKLISYIAILNCMVFLQL